MKESKDHLNIDLEFLDKKEPVRVAPKPEPPKGDEPNWRYYDPNIAKANSGSGEKYNWKNILIISGIVLFFGWVIFSNSGNSNSPSSSTGASSNTNSANNVVTGQYMCSQYNHNRAGELEPSKSQEAALKSEESSLSLEGNRLSTEKDQLQNEYVDQSDQNSIDTHNAAVDDLNSRLASYRYRLTQHSQAIDAYNIKVGVYNNFLIKNCTTQ